MRCLLEGSAAKSIADPRQMRYAVSHVARQDAGIWAAAMNNFGEKVNFIWSIAELLRDRFKRGKYQDVMLKEITR